MRPGLMRGSTSFSYFTKIRKIIPKIIQKRARPRVIRFLCTLSLLEFSVERTCQKNSTLIIVALKKMRFVGKRVSPPRENIWRHVDFKRPPTRKRWTLRQRQLKQRNCPIGPPFWCSKRQGVASWTTLGQLRRIYFRFQKLKNEQK